MRSTVSRRLSGTYALELVAFLRELGADRVRHGGRTLLDHLVGTAAILERWGAVDDACKAGLFHSVYGTRYFRSALLPFDARPRVADKLGAAAERLVHLFCTCQRESIHDAIDRGPPYAVTMMQGGDAVAVSPAELRDLVLILWANVLEQARPTFQSEAIRNRQAGDIARCTAFLPERALRELRAHNRDPQLPW